MTKIPESVPAASVADLAGFMQMIATNLDVNSKKMTFRVACHYAREVERLQAYAGSDTLVGRCVKAEETIRNIHKLIYGREAVGADLLADVKLLLDERYDAQKDRAELIEQVDNEVADRVDAKRWRTAQEFIWMHAGILEFFSKVPPPKKMDFNKKAREMYKEAIDEVIAAKATKA